MAGDFRASGMNVDFCSLLDMSGSGRENGGAMSTPFYARARTLAAAGMLLALSTAQMAANDSKPLSASILNKLDNELVLVVKKSRGEAPFDRPTTQQPDVYKLRGRVLVEIQGTFSRELSDQIANLGGQVVVGWGTTTNFRAWVPFAQLEALAGRADIRSIAAARPSVTRRIKPGGKY
jgi:hypothetical protein